MQLHHSTDDDFCTGYGAPEAKNRWWRGAPYLGVSVNTSSLASSSFSSALSRACSFTSFSGLLHGNQGHHTQYEAPFTTSQRLQTELAQITSKTSHPKMKKMSFSKNPIGSIKRLPKIWKFSKNRKISRKWRGTRWRRCLCFFPKIRVVPKKLREENLKSDMYKLSSDKSYQVIPVIKWWQFTGVYFVRNDLGHV